MTHGFLHRAVSTQKSHHGTPSLAIGSFGIHIETSLTNELVFDPSKGTREAGTLKYGHRPCSDG